GWARPVAGRAHHAQARATLPAEPVLSRALGVALPADDLAGPHWDRGPIGDPGRRSVRSDRGYELFALFSVPTHGLLLRGSQAAVPRVHLNGRMAGAKAENSPIVDNWRAWPERVTGQIGGQAGEVPDRVRAQRPFTRVSGARGGWRLLPRLASVLARQFAGADVVALEEPRGRERIGGGRLVEHTVAGEQATRDPRGLAGVGEHGFLR